jgi:RNA polymerase sigma-70 factor (ECF subfamily)
MKSYSELTEAELVVLAQEGSERAMSKLLSIVGKRMTKIMARKFNGLSMESIEDGIQLSLVKAFKKINTYNPTYSFNSWITRICVNTFIDMKRTSEFKITKLSLDRNTYDSQSESEMPTLGELLPSNYLNPEESMEKDDRAEYAIKLLVSSKIPVAIQEVAQLRYLDELSYEEIVEKTGCPLGTVKARLNRFRNITQETVSHRVHAQY